MATWRVRGAIPEPMKTPLRRLAGRPAPARLGQPAEPSDLARTVEELQLLQLELAHRVSELEERLAASGGGEKAKAKPRSTKR